MLLTEEDAKGRWCPRAYRPLKRMGADLSKPMEEGFDSADIESSRCIASQCMAWQWQPLMADQPFLDAVKEHMELSGDSHAKAVKHVRANLAEYGLPDKPFRGYCGLAGKP